MQRLQVQLILGLLANEFQVRAQRRLGDTFGIVVVVLLPLHERLCVFGWNDPRLKAELAQRAADKMRAEAGFQTDDAAGKPLETSRQVPNA